MSTKYDLYQKMQKCEWKIVATDVSFDRQFSFSLVVRIGTVWSVMVHYVQDNHALLCFQVLFKAVFILKIYTSFKYPYRSIQFGSAGTIGKMNHLAYWSRMYYS